MSLTESPASRSSWTLARDAAAASRWSTCAADLVGAGYDLLDESARYPD